MPQKPADKILDLLKRLGPRTAAELAEPLGCTSVAARQQLTRLEAEGLVEHEDQSGQVGRPRRYYGLTGRGHAHFPDNHAELALGLIEATRAAFGGDGLARLVDARRETQAARYRARMPKGQAPLEKRLRALADLRSEEGYMAEVAKGPDNAWLLIENHCPICAAARACPGICAAEEALFGDVLGPAVDVSRDEYILDGARRCTYRVAAAPN
jgi:predicted ArsR family transcriptional regulator